MTERPLYAHVAKQNIGSLRVLEKCGFSIERDESVTAGGKDSAERVLVLRCGHLPVDSSTASRRFAVAAFD